MAPEPVLRAWGADAPVVRTCLPAGGLGGVGDEGGWRVGSFGACGGWRSLDSGLRRNDVGVGCFWVVVEAPLGFFDFGRGLNI